MKQRCNRCKVLKPNSEFKIKDTGRLYKSCNRCLETTQLRAIERKEKEGESNITSNTDIHSKSVSNWDLVLGTKSAITTLPKSQNNARDETKICGVDKIKSWIGNRVESKCRESALDTGSGVF